jgi:hypothetical protein
MNLLLWRFRVEEYFGDFLCGKESECITGREMAGFGVDDHFSFDSHLLACVICRTGLCEPVSSS